MSRALAENVVEHYARKNGVEFDPMTILIWIEVVTLVASELARWYQECKGDEPSAHALLVRNGPLVRVRMLRACRRHLFNAKLSMFHASKLADAIRDESEAYPEEDFNALVATMG